MEDERVQQEELKHVCRLCNKRFPSGKSLGGHMRSHVIAEARKNKLLMSSSVKKVPTFVDDHNVDVEDNNVDDDDDDEDEDDIEITDRNAGNNNNNNSGYGLRENPKKTWRMVDSYPEKLHQNNTNNNNNNNFNNNNTNNNINNNSNNNVERVCKQCGKGFHSLKALCGHMSIHSEKERHFKEEDDDNSWTSDSIDQLYLAMESHSENNSKRQTRSSNNLSSRYAGSFNAVDSFVNNNNGAAGGSSSNYSEVDQLEQEEVAMCLMMLSRDSSGSSKDWFNFGVVAESSDNNSVILEGGVSKTNNNVVVIGKAKGEILKGKIDVVVDDGHEMDNSDSGYFENGAKVLESDDSVDWFSNKRTIQDVVGVESKESFYGGGGGGKKAIKHDYFYLEKAVSNKYECWICSKSFKTHQALGGHIISHRKNGENNLNNNNSNIIKVNVKNLTKKGSVSKKVKGHKCPYCPKVFKSGQALGGHKRSHMMGSNNHNNNNNNMVLHSEGRLSHIRVSTPPSSPSKTETKQPMIDLNLPAPLEEEGSGNSQFVSW